MAAAPHLLPASRHTLLPGPSSNSALLEPDRGVLIPLDPLVAGRPRVRHSPSLSFGSLSCERGTVKHPRGGGHMLHRAASVQRSAGAVIIAVVPVFILVNGGETHMTLTILK